MRRDLPMKVAGFQIGVSHRLQKLERLRHRIRIAWNTVWTLLRYGHSGLSVVDEHDRLVGVISRRDLDIALHHGFVNYKPRVMQGAKHVLKHSAYVFVTLHLVEGVFELGLRHVKRLEQIQ